MIIFKNEPNDDDDEKKKKKGERDPDIDKELRAEITLKNDKLIFEPKHSFFVDPGEEVKITVKY